MIEILLALVAAFRKDWGAWVWVPLGLCMGSAVGLFWGPEPYRLACIVAYGAALVILALMAVFNRRRILGD
ncbi:MAG: hypothetical protein O2890_12510 [Cyanobacteria bacterium]|nr:hypothetical protein [Cyanobacteriota bacterium]